MKNTYLKNVGTYSTTILFITVIALIISTVTFNPDNVSIGLPFIEDSLSFGDDNQTSTIASGLFAMRVTLAFTPVIVINLIIRSKIKHNKDAKFKLLAIISLILSVISVNLIFIILTVLLHVLMIRNINEYNKLEKQSH